ncbi:ABC transporter permease [Enterococcus canis]|uniref:ABC transporter permease n=1 Tax=Enterococcus canis TaxID=214095 RepID=UPI000AC37EA0|nr:ABC transporter permease subunit [Enterococcus canis]
MTNRLSKRFLGLILATIVIHVVWWLASVLMNQTVLPNPILVYENFPNLLQNQIELHLLVSLGRVFAGMGIALLLGVALGLLMGRVQRFNLLFDPILYLTYPIPKMALLPIVMLLFGLGDASKIIMIVLIVFPQVVLAVRDAVRNIPDHYYDIYQCIGASRWQLFRRITLPATMYAVLSTSRISLGTAISILFFHRKLWNRIRDGLLHHGCLVKTGLSINVWCHHPLKLNGPDFVLANRRHWLVCHEMGKELIGCVNLTDAQSNY